MGYATSLLLAGANVLTPVATASHAQGSQKTQETILYQGSRYCTLLAVYFLAAFAFLGKPFIRLWMGPELVSCYTLLMILVLGEVLPMSQWATYCLVLGIGRHRFIALVYVIEGVLGVTLTLVLLRWYGLAGACLSLALMGFVCRGCVQLWYGCRTVGVPLADYLRRAIVPPVPSAVPPALLLALLTYWSEPRTWLAFVAEGAVYTAVYLATWLWCFDQEHLRVYGLPMWRAATGTAKP